MKHSSESPVLFIIGIIIIAFTSSCCLPGGMICFPPENNRLLFSERKTTPFVNNQPDSGQSVPSEANGSTSKERTIQSTLVAGSNISFKSTEEENHYGGKHIPGVGFQFGVGTTWQPAKKMTIFSALLFKQQNAAEKYEGFQYEPGGNGGGKEEKDKYSLNYISFPVIASYNITNSLSAGIGPELNYLISGTIKPADADKEKITSKLVRVGVGAQAMLRYKLPSKNPKSNFGLQLVYDHRFSRLNKKMLQGYETPAWRMKGIQLSLTYNFCNCK